MHWAGWSAPCVVAVVVCLHGCGAPQPVAPLAVVATPVPTPAAERWIRIRKLARTLTVYDGELVVREYPIVLGKDPVWAKLYQGDHRTPEGEYHIVDKYYHPFWSRFLLLDYPTPRNEEIYEWSREQDLLPRVGVKVPGIGGAIGIHGAEDEGLNERGVNWTQGCVSLFNRDVDELYDLIPVGTRVVIER